MTAPTLAEKLLNPAYAREGVSILGGEPFAQAEGLLALVNKALRQRGCELILCYSGYTLEQLQKKARQQTAIGEFLAELDVLIDGPYVATLGRSAGAWTGSGNQHVILLRERQ